MAIDDKSELAKTHQDAIDMCMALWGGTFELRKQSTKYLPKEPLEQKEAYNARLQRSVLVNFFKKTIKSQSGKICSQEIKVVDDSKAEELSLNIDYQGRDLHRFSHSLVQLAMRDGIRFILIDAPKVNEGEINPQSRPYWVEIDYNDVLDWDIEGGEITYFRYKEKVQSERDEFKREIVEQIREIFPGKVIVHRKGKDEYNVIDEIDVSYDFVPVVPLYAGVPEYPLVCEPPFTDLAHLNIDHWQKNSDHSHILHTSSIAHLFVKGIQDAHSADGNSTQFQFGPNGVTTTQNEGADMKFVEHTGAASGAVAEHINHLEENARSIGADYSTPRPGTMTATQRIIEEGGNLSELAALSLNLNDTLELAWDKTMKMIGREFSGTISLKKDFREYETPITAKDLLEARMAGQIDQETYLTLLADKTGLDIPIEQVINALKNEFDNEREDYNLTQ